MSNKAHRGYGVQGYGPHGQYVAQGVWGTRGMGHMGNRSHGQWGTWTMGPMGHGPMGNLHIFAHKLNVSKCKV